jgi:hypothetical protein
MEGIVAIGEAADVLGVSIATLRRWEAAESWLLSIRRAGIAAMDGVFLSSGGSLIRRPAFMARWW